ncbi:hypothetical protein ACJMK2_025578 [Sinanodonta woodiana]|uniref:Uncharacterized protein n=1 Tax=Sinanodonta woodiana TaxID=1069815 RepID=A0ABD3XIU8_SINWO
MGLAASRQEAFWEACGFGHVEKVRKFLQDGDVDVNWVSYTHDSCPIHVASQGKPDIVKMLIDAKCNVCAKDIRGNMAIHHAAMKGHADIIKMLVDAGSEVNCQDKNGWTPLHNAAYWCQVKAVKVLLECGSDISIQNKDQRTALHETARSHEQRDNELGEIAKLLIDAGSDINAKSSDLGDADLTGLIYAAYHNHPNVALAFIEGGCELDAVGTTMWTALHWAADRGNDELVYILLEAGADPTVKGMRGELAADRAKSSEVKELLLNAVNMHHEMAAINVPVKSESSHSLQNMSFSKSSSSSSVKSSVDMLVNKSVNSSSADKSVNKSASNSSIQKGLSTTESGSNMSVKSDSSFTLQSGKNEVKSSEVVGATKQENHTDGSNSETKGSTESQSISSTGSSLPEIDEKIGTQVEHGGKNTDIASSDGANSLNKSLVQVEEKKDINDDSKTLDPQIKQVEEKDNTVLEPNVDLQKVVEKNKINDDSKTLDIQINQAEDEDHTAIVVKPNVDIQLEKVGEESNINDDSKTVNTKVEEEEDCNIVDRRDVSLIEPVTSLSLDEDSSQRMKISDHQPDYVQTESDTHSECKSGTS